MSRKIRVLFIETGVNAGGSFESLYQTVKSLDRTEFQPFVLYLNHTHYIEKMQQLDVEVFVVEDLLYSHVPLSTGVKAAIKGERLLGKISPWLLPSYEILMHNKPVRIMRKIVRDKDIELVVLNNTIKRHFFCVTGLNRKKVPIISYLRSFITNGMNQFIADYSNRRVSQYVAYSEGVKECWVRTGVDSSKVRVIHNGIEIRDIKPLDVRGQLGIKEKEGPLVGFVGAIKHNRSLDFLIRSFAYVLKEEPGAFLIIVGSEHYGELVEKLKKMTVELGIQESVRFHGKDPEARRIIGGIDILTLPYKIEPFGRVLLEAWLAGTPVVATRKGRIDQIITHGKDGLLVEYGDEKGLCKAILRLWRDKELTQSLVFEGRRTAESRFSINKCTAKVQDLFKKVVLGGGGGVSLSNR